MLIFRSVLGASVGLLLALTSVACLSQTSQTHRQQQQQSQNYQYSAPSARYHSDLVHSASSIDLPSPSFKSLSHKLASQENQISEKPGLLLQTYKSGQQRTVINGNHATYVEPPANFKPIIYEHSQAAPARNQPNDPPATSNGDSFIESSNHLVASMLPSISGQSSSKQQQKRQTQAAAVGQPNQQQQQVFADTQKPGQQSGPSQQSGDSFQNNPMLEPNSNNADEGEGEPNLLPLKPSIDRWSDWTDMSVDPDLASSETQQSPMSSLPAPKVAQVDQRAEQQNQERVERVNRFPTHYTQQQQQQQRKQDGGVQLASSQSGELTPVQILPLINQLYKQQQESQQRMFVANLIKMQQPPVYDPAASYESKRDYIYQATQPRHFYPASQLNAGGSLHEHYYSYQRPSAPQNMPVLYYNPQQQQPSAQMVRSNFVMVNLAPAEPVAMPHKLQQSWRQNPAPGHQQAIGKRMTNLFKANTHDNYYRPELMTTAGFHSEQTRKFRTAANAQAKLVSEQQQMQRRDYQLSAPLVLSPQPQEVSSNVATSTNKQVTMIGGGQAAAASRVLTPQGSGNPVNQVRPSRPAAAATTAQAAVSTASNAQLSSNATSNIPSTAPKRIIKRHRIKTLLPVGLSSWILGGIRDLDARHWKLPDEIMSKLAINDVDLQHPEQANQRTATPADESSSVVNISNQVQTGGSLERADLPRPNAIRTPSSHTSPR